MNLIIAHNDIQQFFPTEVGLSSSYINPFRQVLDGFCYIGVRQDLPMLIISSIKKSVNLIKREFACTNSECNVIKPQHLTLKCNEATRNEKTWQLFSPLEW